MEKTTFKIQKMDCAAEESLVRMKLDGVTAVKNLDFDLQNRQLTVIHNGELGTIESSINELGLGSSILNTTSTGDEESFKEDNQQQRKLLWTVLFINFAFFVLEMTTGIISKSMGLVADSLDMLADALVYGLSLFAVGLKE